MTKGTIYKCDMCDKRFKTPEFVQKHIFNKHKEELDKKFNKSRFEDMMKENYHSDPNKFTNQFNSGSGGGYSGSYQSRDRRGGGGDYRRKYDRENRDEGDEGGKRLYKKYIDYDDPTTNASKNNPER